MAAELTICDLPSEVLERIFSKLKLTDHKSLRLACKRFLNVCSNANITQHELMCVPLKELHLFKNPRGCLNLEIYNSGVLSTDFEQQEHFWVVHGSFIRYLYVTIFKNHFPFVHTLINYCCNVEELTMEFMRHTSDNKFDYYVGGDIVENTKLDNLLFLALAGVVPPEFLSGPTFERLIESVPKLEGLALDDRDRMNPEAIMALITKQANTLIELKFRLCTFANDSYLEKVCDQLGPQLLILQLVHLPIKSINWLCKYADKFTDFETIELRPMSYGGHCSNSLVDLSTCFPKLEAISFDGFSFDDTDMISLAKLKELKVLDIGGRYSKCSAEGIWECFGREQLPNLFALRVEYLTCLTDELLATMLFNMPNLKCLSVRTCPQVTTDCVEAIVYHCENLAHLSLDVAIGAADDLLELSSFSQLKHLVYLNFNRHRIQPLSFDFAFSQLETLVVSNVVVEEFEDFFTNCPNLKLVLLNSCALERIGYTHVMSRPKTAQDIKNFTIDIGLFRSFK